MNESLQTIVGLIGALAGAAVTVLIAWYGHQLNRRQLEATEQQAKTALVQSLNVHDFELHRMFLQFPHLRPYFYDEPRKPVGELSTEDQQRLRCIVAYVLDYFHLIASTQAQFPERVPEGYVEWMRGWLATNPLLQGYLEDHRDEWTSWYAVLNTYRPVEKPRHEGSSAEITSGPASVPQGR